MKNPEFWYQYMLAVKLDIAALLVKDLSCGTSTLLKYPCSYKAPLLYIAIGNNLKIQSSDVRKEKYCPAAPLLLLDKNKQTCGLQTLLKL